MKKNILKAFNWWFIRFKHTKIWRLYTFVPLLLIFFGLSGGYFNIWFILGCVCSLYPVLLFTALIVYAWILNPIREAFPNSYLTKNIISKIDSFIR